MWESGQNSSLLTSSHTYVLELQHAASFAACCQCVVQKVHLRDRTALARQLSEIRVKLFPDNVTINLLKCWTYKRLDVDQHKRCWSQCHIGQLWNQICHMGMSMMFRHGWKYKTKALLIIIYSNIILNKAEIYRKHVTISHIWVPYSFRRLCSSISHESERILASVFERLE